MVVKVSKKDPVDMEDIAAMIAKGLREIDLRFNGVDMRLDILERKMSKFELSVEGISQTNIKTENRVVALENSGFAK